MCKPLPAGVPAAEPEIQNLAALWENSPLQRREPSLSTKYRGCPPVAPTTPDRSQPQDAPTHATRKRALRCEPESSLPTPAAGSRRRSARSSRPHHIRPEPYLESPAPER